MEPNGYMKEETKRMNGGGDVAEKLPERSYGADCRIYVPDHPTNRFKNLYDTVFDEFFLAHIFGWWGKAILIRNQPLLWVLSIGFELLEACVKRIQGDDSGHKHCTGQYFDYWHCIDKCVSICFALHIFFFYFMYTEMKTVILDLQVAPKLFAKLK
uniref:CDP-diacylglycerol--serine O-phosphatidyltransferase n=1 Tax=Brassica campestris TaxID=3711 RepID=M4EDC0_BRACM